MAIKEWVRHYSYERYQRRFGVRTHYEVRSEALCNENPIQYPIPENKAIQKYKAAHYAWVHVFNYFTCLLDRGASETGCFYYVLSKTLNCFIFMSFSWVTM